MAKARTKDTKKKNNPEPKEIVIPIKKIKLRENVAVALSGGFVNFPEGYVVDVSMYLKADFDAIMQAAKGAYDVLE